MGESIQETWRAPETKFPWYQTGISAIMCDCKVNTLDAACSVSTVIFLPRKCVGSTLARGLPMSIPTVMPLVLLILESLTPKPATLTAYGGVVRPRCVKRYHMVPKKSDGVK